MNFSRRIVLVLTTTAVLLPACAQSKSTPVKIFQIGVFDRSSAEFARGTPSQPIHFIIGRSHPERDWFAIQRAALFPSAASANIDNITSAPRTISFSLDHSPAHAYRLRISLLIEGRSVPNLRININGKYGKFYLHPQLAFTRGHQHPSFSQADIVFKFPGGYLRRGVNTITMQVVEDATKAVPDASLTYDAIELDREAGGIHGAPSSAEIFPTVYYQKQLDQLDEIVDVIIRYDKPVKPGSSVDLEVAGNHFRKTLAGNQDFGEEKLEFPVPEFPAQTQAKLKWSIGGRRLHDKQSIAPAKKWTIFLVPHVHLDIGYSDYQAKVAAIQSRDIDEAMDMMAQNPSFRFSLDGEWALAEFLKTRTPADQQRAIAAIQKRRLFVPAQYANLLTGFPTAETLVRSLYASANFSRIHGTPFNYANITDVPSYSWSYASILASAGIEYLLAGSNNGHGPVLQQGHLNEDSPFWWEGPDGQKVLLWYSRMYQQMQLLFGLPPTVVAGYYTLPIFLQQYEHPGYRANAVIMYGTQVENTDLFPQQATLAAQWNSKYAYPHFQYSGFHDALKDIAQQFGNHIPTVSGDGGPYWEDGIASDAYYAAMERQNESRGLSVEKLATLASLVNPLLAADKKDLNRMWTNILLMDEHTWTSHNSVSQPTSTEAVQQLAVKDLYALKAHALADFLARNSMESLADSISAAKNSLIVFNTLNWSRSGFVALDLNKNQEIVDSSTGQMVPYEVLRSGNHFLHVRIVAPDIPAMGYKVFQLRTAEKPATAVAITHTTMLESPYYRVELDPTTGAARSIYDKQLQRELVNQQSAYRFGQYLYVTGGGRDSHLALQIHPALDGKLISVSRTPYGWVARLESKDTNTPGISTEIQLFDHEKKIEFVEDVDKKKVDTKEAVYFAFPFALQQPQFQYEIQTGVVNPATDMYPGAGHEWFSVQHWVSVQQNGISATVMPLDAPLVTLGDINRFAWPTQFGRRPGTIFSYAMNNYWNTNYRAGQGGHFNFRYVLTSAPSTDAIGLSRMGWEEMTPLEHDQVTSQDKATNLPGPLSGSHDSFLEVKDPNVLLDAWKPAENGSGTILRFLDLGGTTRTVMVETPLLQLRQAWLTDAVERNQTSLSLVGVHGFELTVHPHQIVTVRITGKNAMYPPTF